MSTHRPLLVSAFAVVCAACGILDSPPPLLMEVRYQPSVGLHVAKLDAPPIAVGTFRDERGYWGPRTLGVVTSDGQFRAVESSVSVASLAESALADALRVRGALATGAIAKLQLTGVVRHFKCDQAGAEVAIDWSLRDVESKKLLFSGAHSASNRAANRCFASPTDFRELVERTLRRVIDDALDDPAFRSAAAGKVG